jgi:DNA-binding CsgD family transcriptional regulator
MENPGSYSLFTGFIDKYLPQEFIGIDRQDAYILSIEEKLRNTNQFFYITYLLKFKILFTSEGCRKLIGVEPEQFDPYTIFERTHPEDQEHLNRAQAKLFKVGHSLFVDKKGIAILSFCFREKNSEGHYFNLMLQTYSFYADHPSKTVYFLTVATPLNLNVTSKYGHHYYTGVDPSMFRYPDEVLLKSGNNFSHREMEIVKLIASGLGSEQIADKLFLSVNTVNTHRRNILTKTKSSTTHELIMEMQKKGIL